MVDKNSDTPLHLVCKNGNLEIVKLLLKQKGIDINMVDKNSDTPLHLVCKNGNLEID